MEATVFFKSTKLIAASISFCLFTTSGIANNFPRKSPNQLVSISVDCNNFLAQVKWTTSEENVKSTYLIERTIDGVHFEKVANEVENSVYSEPTKVAHEYMVVDEHPYSGISYYRITELDEENKAINVQTIVYTPCENEESINSIIDESGIIVSLNSTCYATNLCSIIILDNENRIVFEQNYRAVNGLNSYKIENKFDSGDYTMVIEHKNHKSFSKAFKVPDTTR